ncbi:MAG TPA: EamA family transporter [Armatimonadetes bacterium]|nr:EamA family transporter [Armatimonadota bacterium]
MFLVLLGALVLRERVGVLKWLGSGVALAGVVVVAWDGRPWAEVFRSEAFGGNLLILLAAGCWSVYALGQKLAVGRGGVSEGLAPILIVATVVSAPFAIAAFHPTGPFTLRLGGYLVALSVLGTAGGYGFLARGLQVLEASTVGMMIVMLPLGTIMAAHFCLGEVVTLWLGLGAVCIIGGIGLVLLSDRRRILAATLLE